MAAGAALLLWTAATILVAATASPTAAPTADPQEGRASPTTTTSVHRADFRLPSDVRPVNYTLRIVTHFQDDDFRFYGQMTVDVDVLRDTSEVRLHAKQLKVDQRSVSLTPLEDGDSNSIPKKELQQQQEEQGHGGDGQHQEQQEEEVSTQGPPGPPQTDESKEQQEQTGEGAEQGTQTGESVGQPAQTDDESKEQPTHTDESDEEQTQTDEPGQEQAKGRQHYQHAPRDASFRGLSLANVTLEPALEQLVIRVSEPLRAGGRYRLAVRYWATLNTEDRGYYRGSYALGDQTRWVSATVFEPTGARRAFPCFDEPHLKATFRMVLGRHANYTSNSNMPLDRTEPMEEAPGWFWDYYPPTPRMSTYLAAFMVHELEGTSAAAAPTVSAPAVRVWAVPGRTRLANYSMSVAPEVLSSLTETLGSPSGMPKHDLVAVPGFKSEALENWGLVSFEENHLLLQANASQLAKQSVSTVVAHELAHSWFGNLITPAWWSDIWLSEGFATYYSAAVLDKMYPGWRYGDTAAGNAFLLVTAADASPYTVPVVHPADSPAVLEDIFSPISYFKGYWVLRMLHGVLGADVFDRAIRGYVRDHLYSSVRTQDLWDSLQAAVDERAEEDLQAAASGQQGSDEDIVVVGDDEDDDDEEFARVVVPSSSKKKAALTNTAAPTTAAPTTAAPTTAAPTTAAPTTAAPTTAAPTTAVPTTSAPTTTSSPTTTSATTNTTSSVNGSSKLAPKTLSVSSRKRARRSAVKAPITQIIADGADSVPVVVKGPTAVKAVAAAAAAPLPFPQDGVMQVVSPPRRGPAPTGYTGRVGWLPRPVAQIMRGWVHQRGYPIINVYRNLETGVVTINQRRFLAVAGAGASVACNATTSAWWIPVRFTTASKAPSPSSGGGAAPAADTVFWVPPTCANITLPVKVARDDWLVLNSGLIGLYRVRYDARTLTQLSKLPRAAWLQMAPVTRLQLVSDSLDLARLGRAPYQTVLRMLSLLGRDPNPMVWRAALPHLIMLQRQLRTRRDGVALRSWLQDLVSPHAPSIGFTTRPQDTPNQASLRVKVTTLACLADHAVCQRKAKKALKQFMAGNTDAITPGRTTHTQLCAAVRWGGPAEWRFLRAQLSDPASLLPRKAVVSALGCSRDPETLRSLLADTVVVESAFRRADVAAVLTSVAANEAGADITLRFMEERAAQLYKRLGEKPSAVDKAVRDVAASLTTKRQLDRLDAVLRQFQPHTHTRATPAWGRDVVQENIRWAERSRGEVSRWLRARVEDDDVLELRGNKRKAAAKGASKGGAHRGQPITGPRPAAPPGAQAGGADSPAVRNVSSANLPAAGAANSAAVRNVSSANKPAASSVSGVNGSEVRNVGSGANKNAGSKSHPASSKTSRGLWSEWTVGRGRENEAGDTAAFPVHGVSNDLLNKLLLLNSQIEPTMA